MTDAKITIAVKLAIVNRYGTPYLTVTPMKRENDDSFPLNITSGFGWEIGSDLADLELSGFWSDFNDHSFIGFEAAFHDASRVDTSRAASMLKVMKKIDKAIGRDNREIGDYFTAFCKAIGATQAVVETSHSPGGSLRNSTWRWMSIAEGRNTLREMKAAQDEKSPSPPKISDKIYLAISARI